MSLAPLKFGTVHGRFVAAVADSKDDPDLDPDARPLTGTVTFTPDASAILLPNGLEAPATVMTPPIVAALDDQGYITAGGARGVRLIASDNPGANPVNFTYTVTLNLRMGNTPIKYPGWSISVPSDQNVDLTLVGRVPTSSGTPLTRGVGVQEVTATDGVITFLLTDGNTSEITIQGDIVTDEFLATTVREGAEFRGEVEGIADARLNDGGVISSAVDAEIAERNLLVTQDVLEEDGPIFAIVDEDGKRTWLEADASGGPTDHSANLIVPAVTGPVADSIGLADQNDEITGVSFAIVDEDNRRTDIELGLAGEITERVMDKWKSRLGITDSDTALRYQPLYSQASYPIVSGPDIVCWGDSMTAGAGGGGRGYPVVLQELTGRTVHNRGVGGESSVTITARSGATPFMVVPEGGAIPASGSVVVNRVALPGTDGRIPAPMKQGSASWPNGTLAGVRGTLSRSTAADGTTDVYTFTRTSAGDVVTANRPTPFLSDDAEARRGDIAIIWIGQNGPSHTRAKADVKAIVDHLNALNKRYLVISRPTSSDTEDAEWHDIYGRRFVAIRKYLVEYGLEDAGITPTETDTTDIAAGRVPTSLRVDGVHFNAAGYEILAKQLNNRLREMGWV